MPIISKYGIFKEYHSKDIVTYFKFIMYFQQYKGYL